MAIHISNYTYLVPYSTSTLYMILPLFLVFPVSTYPKVRLSFTCHPSHLQTFNALILYVLNANYNSKEPECIERTNLQHQELIFRNFPTVYQYICVSVACFSLDDAPNIQLGANNLGRLLSFLFNQGTTVIPLWCKRIEFNS
jgi:hypothetical protein